MTIAAHPFAFRRHRISAVILTRNEEALIGRCLQSLDGLVDDIVVVDSCSTDRTCEIARQFNARVFQQSWLGWIPQRALGIALAHHDWVLILEADEIVTPALACGLNDVLRGEMHPDDGYSMDRRDDFLGALLPRMRRRSKRLGFIRVFNRTRSAYDPNLIVHDEVRVPGRAIPLPGALIHWRGFSIVDQVNRYASYAPLEAEVLAARRARVSVLSLVWRPMLRFGWCYIICGGVRLGARGFAHALMAASSEFLRHAAYWERKNAPATLHPPPNVAQTFGIGRSLTATPTTRAIPKTAATTASDAGTPAASVGTATPAGIAVTVA